MSKLLVVVLSSTKFSNSNLLSVIMSFERNSICGKCKSLQFLICGCLLVYEHYMCL